MNLSTNFRKNPQRLRGRIREAVRAAILEAGEAVFVQEGIQGARVEEIAARAGVSVGTLYNYFGDRQSLVEALIEAHRTAWEHRLDEALARKARGDFHEQLTGFLEGVVLYLQEHWDLIALLFGEDWANERGNGATHHRQRSFLHVMYERAQKVLHLGTAQGALRREAADLLPALLVGTIRGAVVHQIYKKRGAPSAAVVESLRRFFLEGAGSRRR